MPILEVRNLTLGLKERRIALVEDISFFVEKGEVLGILGESGCGKSLTGFAILKLFPSGIIPYDGDVFYKGISLYSLSERELLKIRGKKMKKLISKTLMVTLILSGFLFQACEKQDSLLSPNHNQACPFPTTKLLK